ncbi:hypothetical protein FQN60_013940, partial [Etheostoma spectabile]
MTDSAGEGFIFVTGDNIYGVRSWQYLLEVVNTATGQRRDSGTPSRLCKHALFTRWDRLYRKSGIRLSGSVERQLMYCEAKMAARSYQTVKQQWFRSLQEMGLGTWVKKPPEQEQFLLSD